MHSSTSSFERRTPDQPWGQIALVAVLLTLVAFAAWEIRARSKGYVGGFDDTMDIWAGWRNSVKPDSVVIIGDSRPLFDLDLNTLEGAFGKRPIQLAIAGSSCFPVLQDLANDESFRGDVIVSLVPIMYFTPGSPLMKTSVDALQRRRTQSPSQWFSNQVYMLVDEWVASFNMEDLNLANLLLDLPIPNREGSLVPPRFPPCFQVMDRDRRTWMLKACEEVGGPMQQAVVASWQRLFVEPPPPTWVPAEAFREMMGKEIEGMYGATVTAVEKIRARGGRVVFVRFPHTGWLKEVESHATPRGPTWDRVLAETRAPGIHFEDYPELAGFDCPEWSHLSASDSVEFTKRLAPHLKRAFEQQKPQS